MRVMMSQTNPTVGDLKGNLAIIKTAISTAVRNNAHVLLMSELVTTGYPPRDLLYQQSFWDDHDKIIDNLAQFVYGLKEQITVIIGGLQQTIGTTSHHRFNAAWVIDKKYGMRAVRKQLLPCYDVFDETRYFESEKVEVNRPIPIDVDGESIDCHILVCEDIWNDRFRCDAKWMPSTYDTDPIEQIGNRFVDGPLFVLNASPFWVGKMQQTHDLVEGIALRLDRPVFWCNQVGAHDDIVFGGYSMIVLPEHDSTGLLKARHGAAFKEDTILVDLTDDDSNLYADGTDPDYHHPVLNGVRVDQEDFYIWSIYAALRLHIRDYTRRTGFKRVHLGLSGGIDSAVVAALGVSAMGAENVAGLTMPSPYSSLGSVDDSRALADNLRIFFDNHSITKAYEAIKHLFLSGGKPEFDKLVTDENIQPRLRGVILMAHSNEFDSLLLTTGNKSEIAQGYCTLYGDMCGGLAVISDVYKTEVFHLARFMNKYLGNIIPEATITKPPSAELRFDQKDTDTLPDYPVLDPMLICMVENDLTPTDLKRLYPATAQSMAWEEIEAIHRRYERSEFKRQQMPPGPKIHERSFGSGRRMPIAMKRTRI